MHSMLPNNIAQSSLRGCVIKHVARRILTQENTFFATDWQLLQPVKADIMTAVVQAVADASPTVPADVYADKKTQATILRASVERCNSRKRGSRWRSRILRRETGAGTAARIGV